MAGKSPKDLRAENERLSSENEELRLRLEEAEQALEAIRTGQAESLIVEGPNGPRIFSLEGADHSYRVLVEAMNEGAATLGEDGTILYCNARFAEMLGRAARARHGQRDPPVPPGALPGAFEALAREANGGESRGELVLLGQGGQVVPAYLSMSVIHDESGAASVPGRRRPSSAEAQRGDRRCREARALGARASGRGHRGVRRAGAGHSREPRRCRALWSQPAPRRVRCGVPGEARSAGALRLERHELRPSRRIAASGAGPARAQRRLRRAPHRQRSTAARRWRPNHRVCDHHDRHHRPQTG